MMKPLLKKFWTEPQPIIAVLSAGAAYGSSQVGLSAPVHVALVVAGLIAAGASARAEAR